jgi:dipeptidyl aminopeptidase/acylaminoacyl peptidase
MIIIHGLPASRNFNLASPYRGAPMILILLVLLLLPATGVAQITPEQVLNVRQISDLRMSPDGRQVAFTITEPVKGTDRNTDIYLLDVATHQIRQLTSSAKSETSPRWRADGRALAFLSDREGDNQIYLLSMDGGEAQRLTEGKLSIQSFDWSPDGKLISFLAPEARTDAEEKKIRDRDDARVVDKDNRLARLWIFDVVTKKVRQLTSGPWRVSDPQWKPNGEGLVVIASNHPELDQPTSKIYSISASGGELAEVLTPQGNRFGQVSISSDGKTLAWQGPRDNGEGSADIWVRPLAGGQPRNLTAAVDRQFSHMWMKDGSMLSIVQTGFRSVFYRITLDGKPEPMPRIDTNPGTVAATPGMIVFVGQTATQMPEIYVWDGKGTPEKVSKFNEHWDKIALIKPEVFTYKSFDGMEIEGSLLKPVGYPTGAKMPLIVHIHGGPAGRWQDSLDQWGQMLASRGYAVFAPNIRGSTGYGQNFLGANKADWGGGDFKDVMAGVDYLIQKGIADPDRLGIGGWSYGGYMSMWAVTQTNRFKASVAGAGLSDLASEFGTEANSSGDEWYFGTPYEHLDAFIKCSPITFIKNIRTPTLILQGEADTTDPIGQSQQFYRGAKRYGAECDFVLYPREPHGFREEKHMIDRDRRMLEWFMKYIPAHLP